jgi:hypothetical protein
MKDITRLSYEEFLEIIIAQDDDNDYDESGYVVVYNGEVAAIARYGHCSCYGTHEALQGRNGKITWDWTGSIEELLKMARYKLDPHYSLGTRKAKPDDYDYDHLMACYKQTLEWNKKRQK